MTGSSFLFALITTLSKIYFLRADTVRDVSSEVFGLTDNFVLAAFGDFNADKHTDIFAINTTDNSVHILLAPEKQQDKFHQVLLFNHFSTIKGVIPGDFDGDLILDVMVVAQADGSSDFELSIYWGQDAVRVVNQPFNATGHMTDHPFVIDWGGDMISAVLVEKDGGSKVVWKFGNKTCDETDVSSVFKSEWKKPHSHAFADWNGDLSAEIILSTKTGFEVWERSQHTFKLLEEISLPDGAVLVGQAAFVDFDQDTIMDILLPDCQDNECKTSYIHLYTKKTSSWSSLEPFSSDQGGFGFVPSDENLAQEMSHLDLPIALRAGDFDMDGYPDVLALLRPADGDSKGKSQSIFLMYNRQDSSGNRMLDTQWGFPFSADTQALLPTFFDLYEDGLQDVLVTTTVSGANSNSPSRSVLTAWANKYAADACFIKVTVVSYRCYSHRTCPGDRDPYGINLPGPTVTYSTTETDGSLQRSTGTQLSKAAHFALQLPYTIFGLGQTPNFVESLDVGIPINNKSHNTFQQVIPNSQLVVMPYPPDQPSKWRIQLYITPSQAIYITGASLAGTCLLVAVVVGLLHWREKVEDKKEKEQEAHKFNFDAM